LDSELRGETREKGVPNSGSRTPAKGSVCKRRGLESDGVLEYASAWALLGSMKLEVDDRVPVIVVQQGERRFERGIGVHRVSFQPLVVRTKVFTSVVGPCKF